MLVPERRLYRKLRHRDVPEDIAPRRPDADNAGNEHNGPPPGFWDGGGGHTDRQTNERFNHQLRPQSDVDVLWPSQTAESSRICGPSSWPYPAAWLVRIRL